MTLAPCDIAAAFPEVFRENEIVSVKSMTGDASSRKYLRVLTIKDFSYVLQVAEPFDGETSFSYGQKIFKLAGVRVPEIVARHGVKGWLLLEDLGELDFQGKVNASNLELVLEPLVKLFSLNLSSLQQRVPQAPHWGWSFDVAKLSAELDFFKKHFLETYLGRSANQVVFFQRCCERLSSSKRILCHRDYHTRNIMNHKGECVVIDFQDARLGPASYDWVSILWDPYSPLSNALRDQGEALFHKLHQEHLGVSLDSSKEEYWMCLLQRMLKAVGSYASFKNLQGRSDYLNYIVPALMNARVAFDQLSNLGVIKSNERELGAQLDSWTEAAS